MKELISASELADRVSPAFVKAWDAVVDEIYKANDEEYLRKICLKDRLDYFSQPFVEDIIVMLEDKGYNIKKGSARDEFWFFVSW